MLNASIKQQKENRVCPVVEDKVRSNGKVKIIVICQIRIIIPLVVSDIKSAHFTIIKD